MRTYSIPLLAALAVFGGLNARAADQTPDQKAEQATIVLTSKENGLQTQQDFSCQGKIHGYIRFAHRQHGAHVLESRWINPSGKVAAQSRTNVDFHPVRSTAYVWFAFPEHPILGAPDPALDQELLTYNGHWRLEVKWDEKHLILEPFNVHCP